MRRLAVFVLALLCSVSVAWAGNKDDRSEQKIVASGVTTNTTTAAVAVPIGAKSFYGQVVGTGAITQTQAIFGDIDNDAANGILLCTLTLSGTTRTQDACPVVTAQFSYYYVTTTNTTGTGATGSIYAMY